MYCEESRAARVTLVTVLVVSLTWTPHLAILTMSEPPAWLHHLTVATITSYSVISPVIFAFRSRRVQRELRKVFGIRQEVQTRPLNFFLLFALFALKIIAEFFTSLLSQKLSEKDKMLSKLKSLSCPHLVLTSCQSIQAGPGKYFFMFLYIHNIYRLSLKKVGFTFRGRFEVFRGFESKKSAF